MIGVTPELFFSDRHTPGFMLDFTCMKDTIMMKMYEVVCLTCNPVVCCAICQRRILLHYLDTVLLCSSEKNDIRPFNENKR